MHKKSHQAAERAMTSC